MIFGSICSGIEGASVAWEQLGWRCAFMAETEAFPRAVLKHHYPDVPLHSDFTQLRDHHREALAEVDVLVGGTPCQGFSVAGLRGSLSDDRSNLCLEFIRLGNAIDDLRRAAGRPPCWILWENVPGVFSTDDNAFGAFLGGLVGDESAVEPRGGWTDAGVAAGPNRVAAWRVLDAQHFGLAQRRRRVFVLALGGAGAWRCADALLPLGDSLQGYSAPRRQAQQRAPAAAGPGAPAGGGHAPDLSKALMTPSGGIDREDRHTLIVGDDAEQVAYGGNRTGGPIDIATAMRAKGGTGHGDFESETFVTHALTADGFDASEDGSGRGTPLITHALDAYSAGRATEDGTGRGAPLVPWPLEVADPITAVEGKTYTHEGTNFRLHNVVAHPISADALRGEGTALTPSPDAEGRVRLRDPGLGVGEAGDPAGTLQATGPGAVFTLAARGRDDGLKLEFRDDELANAILTPSGGRAGIGVGAVAIGITLHGSDGTRSTATETETASSLRARPPGGIDNCTTTAVLAFTVKDHGADADEEVAPTLRAGGHDKSHANAGVMPAVTFIDTAPTVSPGHHGAAGHQHRQNGNEGAVVGAGSAVRRLTPVECARLQGFPDDYLDIDFRGKPAADGPKYKALGNAFAVPCVRWIGERIAAV